MRTNTESQGQKYTKSSVLNRLLSKWDLQQQLLESETSPREMQAPGGTIDGVQVKGVGKCMIFLLILTGTEN